MKIRLPRWFLERCHWQNLNEKGREDVKGTILRHGRAWLRFDKEYKNRFCIAWLWILWTHFWGAEVTFAGGDSDSDLSFFFGCGLFAFWFTFEGVIPQKVKDLIQFHSIIDGAIIRTVWLSNENEWSPLNKDAWLQGANTDFLTAKFGDNFHRIDRLIENKSIVIRHSGSRINETTGSVKLDASYDASCGYWGMGRQVGVKFHNGAMLVSVWEKSGEWNSTDPWWMSWNFNPADFFFGSHKYSSRELDHDTRSLLMPEGISYPVDIVLREDSWKRPRLPWSRKIVRSHIECKQGIPHPGKGESEYDCGEDATFGLTCQARTFDEALSKLYTTVMQSRERYGGKNWKPEQKVSA